jgi:amino acid transporter
MRARTERRRLPGQSRLEYPKLKNLKRAGWVIFIYSLLFTSLVSFFAVALIPDEVRPKYFQNLISGLTLFFVGPGYLKLIFQLFVVVVGFLMLSGAVNTSMIGSNGVLSRVSEDGVLTDWFRKPHKKYGTNYRIVNLVAILQIVTIVASRGNVLILGAKHAFGVIWSHLQRDGNPGFASNVRKGGNGRFRKHPHRNA